MIYQSVALVAIASSSETGTPFTRRLLSERTAEGELLWLIQVGVLRREVDGQGLTDSFRVTPLGRQLVQQWQQQGQSKIREPNLSDRFSNLVSRWLRLPV